MLSGDLHVPVLESELLRGNPLGDPCLRELPVYLPPGGGTDLPLIGVLAGYTGTGASALHGTPWDPSFLERYEGLLVAGTARPAAFVFPNAFTRFGGSQYVNSTATGRYQDYIVEEVFPFVAREYGVGMRRERRGLAGKSSGGFGALHACLTCPEQFAALASHSGDAGFELCYKPDFPRLLDALGRSGGLEAFVQAFERAPRKTTPLILAMSVLALAAAYSPEPGAPLGLALPFDERTGRLRQDVWARWLEHDPVHLAETHGEVLADYALVFVDAGLRDEYHLQYGARQLVEVLRGKGVRVEHEEFDDGHRGVGYRYERSLPLLTRALSA